MKNVLKKIFNFGNQFERLIPEKKRLIDFAVKRFQIHSIADLGGVWNVDGGYSFYALQKPEINKVILVDTDFNESVLEKKQKSPNLELITGNFGDSQVVERIGNPDAVLFFDTLLHQVSPDWDQILEMYASKVNCVIIYNQQFIASKNTIRLIDLGEEEYFRNVPHDRTEGVYKVLFEKLDENHPQHQRPHRDIHNVWQWGITDNDLIDKMNSLGFTLQYYKNNGRFGNLENFEDHSFVFYKQKTEYKYKS